MTGADGGAPAVGDDGDRFVVAAAGSVAELTYLLRGDELVLLHTGVPESMSGRGIGASLVRAAVERAARDGLTLVPWCAFARRWLRDHPEVAATVTIDWAQPDRR